MAPTLPADARARRPGPAGGRGFVDALRAGLGRRRRRLPPRPAPPRPGAAALLAALRPGRRRSVRTARGPGSPAARARSRPATPSSWPPAARPGHPRGVVLTHEARGRLGPGHLRPPRRRPGRATAGWPACPWPTSAGSSVVTRALCTGTPLVVLPGFDAAAVEAIGRAGRATHVALVATALGRLDPRRLPAVLARRGGAARAAWPANVVATYGMTETGSGVVYDGRPLDGVEVRIGDGRPGGGRDRRGPRARAPCCCGAIATGPTRGSPGPTGPAAGCPPATAGGSTPTAASRSTAGWPRSSSPAARRSGRPPSSGRARRTARRGRGGRVEAARPRVGRAGGGLGGAGVDPADPPDARRRSEPRSGRAGRRGPPPRSWSWSTPLPRTPSGKVRRAALT